MIMWISLLTKRNLFNAFWVEPGFFLENSANNWGTGENLKTDILKSDRFWSYLLVIPSILSLIRWSLTTVFEVMTLTIKLVTPFLKSAIVLSRSNWSIPGKKKISLSAGFKGQELLLTSNQWQTWNYILKGPRSSWVIH